MLQEILQMIIMQRTNHTATKNIKGCLIFAENQFETSNNYDNINKRLS